MKPIARTAKVCEKGEHVEIGKWMAELHPKACILYSHRQRRNGTALGGLQEQEARWSRYRSGGNLPHIIHDRFYCNRRDAAATSQHAPLGMLAGRLAPRGLNVLFQVRLGRKGLHVPVSLGVSAVSSRTVMNNVG